MCDFLAAMGSVLTFLTLPITVGLTLLSARPADLKTYCKWLVSYIYVAVYKRLTSNRFDLYDMELNNEPSKVGILPPQEEITLESPFPESHLLHGADEIFFYGVNSASECLVVRLARGCNDQADAWIYLKLKNGKVYQLKKCSSYQQSCSDKRAFTCGGLQMHYISPMRRWRIFFNGLLRETSNEDPSLDKMVHVKLACIWMASSDPFDFTSDVNSEALTTAISKAKWRKPFPPLKKLYRTLNFYAQSGNIIGTVNIDEDSEERRLYFLGERLRFLGHTSEMKSAQFSHVLGHISRTGAIIHIAEASIENIVENLKFGFIVLPCGRMEAIADLKMTIKNLTDEDNFDVDVKASFTADERPFKVKANLTGNQAQLKSKEGWDGDLTIDCLNLQLNSMKGSGVLIKGKIIQPTAKRVLKPPFRPKTAVPLVSHFTQEICQVSEVTGGKGSSLGKLTQLSKELQNFIVPNGVVVTTAAYQAFITKEIVREIKQLENVLYGKLDGDVKEACKRVRDEVIKTNLPDQLLEAITKSLQKAFGDDVYSKKFAIRSSATGEDTEQMSAAGQMETFLGITGFSEVILAVKKCWASQFGFVASQYKRQYGQVLNSPMAVVIQEMIPCDVAGVLFTCDPLTGSPTVVTITANYGLGESVVSASEDPDTIELGRDADDNLEIKNKIIGAKSRRIIMRGDEGTVVQEVAENERRACCLSDDKALRLGNLAIKIETSYRSHRDIEWGFWNNNLYIFQSRPVTSGSGETDFEIDHERDSALRIENEYISVCNIGEVMPGAMSPLGLDLLMKYYHIMVLRPTFTEYQSSIRLQYLLKMTIAICNHLSFSVIDLLERVNEGKAVIDSFMVALFGRILDDEALFQAAMDRYGTRKKDPFISKYFRMIKTLCTAKGILDKTKKAFADYRIPVEKYKTADELFNKMLRAITDIVEPFVAHMLCTQSSSIWNMIIITMLQKATGELNDLVYRDFAHLLSAISEVESADIPSSMQSLAFHISKDLGTENFKKMEAKEVAQWLKNSSSIAGVKFREFLERHGHRCLNEFDIHSLTWGTNPEQLIQMIQNLVGTVSEDRETKKESDFGKMISELQIPLEFGSKMLLRILLPLCRREVQNREASKSLLIKIIDAWRKGYRRLAKIMVAEGRVPDEELIFFMTLDEIKELLSTRSPKIISKAMHRRKRYPVLNKYLYPEIMTGIPKPINEDMSPVLPAGDNISMKGIPVSQGVAKGFVRVALTLEEASDLKPGEILITYSTDIGWTPYFPILAGVITELGGLVSHGAVVSREYGLPCIVGLHGATRLFQTGDYVLLDGSRGILQKLSLPE